MDANKLRELAGLSAPQEIIRGWEITRGPGIPTGMKYAPTFLGACQCAADVKWLQGRHQNKGYEMRAIVSVSRELPEVKEVDGPSSQAVDEALSSGVDAMQAAAIEADDQETNAG